MKRLAAKASDEDLLRAVGEWVGLLAEERYQEAYDFLYHPWMPVLPVNELSADAIRAAVTNYGWDEPHPSGPFKVTPVATAPPKEGLPDSPPYQDIQRYEQPEERAFDPVLVQHGGTPTGASILGTIHFTLPLNGQWSDLTAIIRVVLYDGAVVLYLESIDVL